METLGTICAGVPHLASSSKIGKAFKLTKVSGHIGEETQIMKCCKEFMEHAGVQKKI